MSRHAGPQRPVPRRRVWGIALGTAVLLVLALGGQGTYAAFSDSATVTGGAFTSGSVAMPINGQCVDPSGTSVTIQWSNVDVRYRYRAQVLNASGSVIGTATVANNAVAGGTQTLVIAPGQHGTKSGGFLRENYTVQIRSEIGSEWYSPAITVPISYEPIIVLVVPLPYLRCG